MDWVEGRKAGRDDSKERDKMEGEGERFGNSENTKFTCSLLRTSKSYNSSYFNDTWLISNCFRCQYGGPMGHRSRQVMEKREGRREGMKERMNERIDEER
jgi:hypothetical protein